MPPPALGSVSGRSFSVPFWPSAAGAVPRFGPGTGSACEPGHPGRTGGREGVGWPAWQNRIDAYYLFPSPSWHRRGWVPVFFFLKVLPRMRFSPPGGLHGSSHVWPRATLAPYESIDERNTTPRYYVPLLRLVIGPVPPCFFLALSRTIVDSRSRFCCPGLARVFPIVRSQLSKARACESTGTIGWLLYISTRYTLS